MFTSGLLAKVNMAKDDIQGARKYTPVYFFWGWLPQSHMAKGVQCVRLPQGEGEDLEQ